VDNLKEMAIFATANPDEVMQRMEHAPHLERLVLLLLLRHVPEHKISISVDDYNTEVKPLIEGKHIRMLISDDHDSYSFELIDGPIEDDERSDEVKG